MIHSFDPIAAPDARVLVLGTIPGRRSLEAGEYYAHPQNAFWFIMESLFAPRVGMDYAARASLLLGAQVALWDVLQAADRIGSLDSAIVSGSERLNDFAGFFIRHPAIHTVFFNGAKAQSLFARHVLGALSPEAGLRLVRLPSTSPANATLSRERKLAAWRVLPEALAVS
ncbi:MAG: DNA-deoxyinosine glycosylase [Deltaproteobacteria bacterium]|nr:DNA-deoxyinosine glycosylase [Deltaproteobacteria bacterium]